MAKGVKYGLMLKALIHSQGETLESIAQKIGLSRVYFSGLINGGKLTPQIAMKVGEALDVDVGEVLEAMGEEPTPRPPGRCEQLESENEKLREDLEQANETIRNLSVSIRALTAPK